MPILTFILDIGTHMAHTQMNTHEHTHTSRK